MFSDSEFDQITNVGQNDDNKTHGVYKSHVVTWTCVYLVFWQFTFGITDTYWLWGLNQVRHHLIWGVYNLWALHKNLFSWDAIKPLYVFQTLLYKEEQSTFTKYVVCFRCFQILQVSKRCSNILFPNHPQVFWRRPCRQSLLMFLLMESHLRHFPLCR